MIRLYRKLATSMRVYHRSPWFPHQFIHGIFFTENGKGGIMDGFLSQVFSKCTTMYTYFLLSYYFKFILL